MDGKVSDEGVPLVEIDIAGHTWQAIVDTGFNGDLELPDALRGKLNDQPAGRLRSSLAGGKTIEEDAFTVEFLFDGKTYQAVATFVSDPQVLIGTNLLRNHRLEIGFVSKSLRLERE